ncbi:MAG: MFS transporter [Myxococcales bacterium]|nr:MFS transporter [Myxococcales bacterium]
MNKTIKDPNIWRVYGATFALGLAYGVALSLIAIFLDARGFDKTSIGTLAAWFASGIVLFSLPMGALIRRFSAKTILFVSLAGYAAAVGAFAFADGYAAIAAIRFCDGAFSVGIWVSSETILLSRAESGQKAFVTSLYAIALAVGYVVGPIAARGLAAVAPLTTAFLVASGIAASTALFVALRLDPDLRHEADVPTASSGSASRAVLWRIKTSCFATFCYGYFQSSVVLFLPLFLIAQKHVAKEQTIVIPAFFAGGMLLFSNVAGRLGDRVGHLRVMRVLAVVGLSMILGFVLLDSYAAMCAAVFVAGASLASISPVSLALQGVVCQRRDFSRATSIYNAFYAAGMLLGPPISSVLFQRLGGGAMLIHLAGLWGAFVLFSVVFAADDPASRVPLIRSA